VKVAFHVGQPGPTVNARWARFKGLRLQRKGLAGPQGGSRTSCLPLLLAGNVAFLGSQTVRRSPFKSGIKVENQVHVVNFFYPFGAVL